MARYGLRVDSFSLESGSCVSFVKGNSYGIVYVDMSEMRDVPSMFEFYSQCCTVSIALTLTTQIYSFITQRPNAIEMLESS